MIHACLLYGEKYQCVMDKWGNSEECEEKGLETT